MVTLDELFFTELFAILELLTAAEELLLAVLLDTAAAELLTAAAELLLLAVEELVTGAIELAAAELVTTVPVEDAAVDELEGLRISAWIKAATFLAQAASQAAGSAGGILVSIFVTRASKSLHLVALHT